MYSPSEMFILMSKGCGVNRVSILHSGHFATRKMFAGRSLVSFIGARTPKVFLQLSQVIICIVSPFLVRAGLSCLYKYFFIFDFLSLVTGGCVFE
jgi:hypothetical protein